MDFNKKALILLVAIIGMVVSAGAISAAEDADVISDSNNGEVVTADDSQIAEGSSGGSDDVSDVSGDNDYDGSQGPDVNPPVSDLNATNNTTNVTGNATGNVTGNVTGNATTNATNATVAQHKLNDYVTGNPILALLAVSAIAGGFTLRRK